MESHVQAYLSEAESDLALAKVSYVLSTDKGQRESLSVPKEVNFLKKVSTLSYFAMFHAAKALLISNGIITNFPNEHIKTYLALKDYLHSKGPETPPIRTNRNEAVTPKDLLKIFYREKDKRVDSTYKVTVEATQLEAETSLSNADTFISAMKCLLGHNGSSLAENCTFGDPETESFFLGFQD